MAEYIDREAFIRDKRKFYCENCDKRKGMKKGKMRFVYDIGDAPCRACDVDDMIYDIETYPVARCNDCRYSYDSIGGTYCACGVCVDYRVEPDFFCANWEGKDDAE